MILNYTTTIEAEQTISEIQRMLSRFDVQAMMTEYDGQQVSAVTFILKVDGQPMSFRLPCNWRALAVLLKEPKARRNARIKKGETWDDQAIRVAWRIIKDWIEAQLALVEINMVTIPQIFLPYMVTQDGRTLGERINDDPRFLLGPGK